LPRNRGLPSAAVSNAAGTFVKLTPQNATNFIGKAKVTGTGKDLALTFDYTNTTRTRTRTSW